MRNTPLVSIGLLAPARGHYGRTVFESDSVKEFPAKMDGPGNQPGQEAGSGKRLVATMI
jgi:hypothetical protein